MASRGYLHGLYGAHDWRRARRSALGRPVRPDRRDEDRIPRRGRDVHRPDGAEMAKRSVDAVCALLRDRRDRICLPVRAAGCACRIVVQRAQGIGDRHRHCRRRHRSGHRALPCAAPDHGLRLARRHALSRHRLFRHSVSAHVPAPAGAFSAADRRSTPTGRTTIFGMCLTQSRSRGSASPDFFAASAWRSRSCILSRSASISDARHRPRLVSCWR